MKEPHEEGVAIRSAPSFALGAVRRPAKRKQGHRWAGYRASKSCNQGADAVASAEGNMASSANASCWSALRSHRPHARLETPCTRTGRPRRSITQDCNVLECGRLMVGDTPQDTKSRLYKLVVHGEALQI